MRDLSFTGHAFLIVSRETKKSASVVASVKSSAHIWQVKQGA